MLEVGFKHNSIPKPACKMRFAPHILWISLISSRCGTSNTPPHAEVYSSRAWARN